MRNTSSCSAGSPITLKRCKTFIGIINCGENGIYLRDTRFGIPIGAINTYLCSVEKNPSTSQKYVGRSKILISLIKFVDNVMEKLNLISHYLKETINSYDSDVEAFKIRRRTAPGNIIFEIHYLIVLKCERDEYQTIFELSQVIHKKLTDSFDSFFIFSYLYEFEHSRWFSVKENKSHMEDIVEDNHVIDELVSDQFLSTEEYKAIKELTTNKRINKFVEIISKRYPADIDMITVTLQKKQFIGLANYLKMVKENAMSVADPIISLIEKSLVNNCFMYTLMYST